MSVPDLCKFQAVCQKIGALVTKMTVGNMGREVRKTTAQQARQTQQTSPVDRWDFGRWVLIFKGVVEKVKSTSHKGSRPGLCLLNSEALNTRMEGHFSPHIRR